MAVAAIVERYHALKQQLLEDGSRAQLAVTEVVQLLDWLSNVRRCAEQIEKSTRFLASLTLPLPAPSDAPGHDGDKPSWHPDADATADA